MHPAYSVIFFTTSSGAGYGLLALLGLMGAFGLAPVSQSFAIISMIIAHALITFGLLSSTFHLGHPERAWRALSQWQTSWLSREGVLAVITYPIALIYGATWSGFILLPVSIPLFGALTALFAMATVFSTGQIYATLKTIRAWNHPLTTPVYLVFSIASGFALFNAISALIGSPIKILSILAGIASLTLLILKVVYWCKCEATPHKLTIEDATGLKGKVRQWELPHTQKNYVQREMGFVVARRHSERIRALVFIFLLISSVTSVAVNLTTIFALISFSAIAAGAIFERWLFFAEGEHVVTLFYGNKQA